MRKSLPSQFENAVEQSAKIFLRIAGLDRVVTAGAVDLIQGTSGNVRIQMSDGAVLQVRKYDPEEIVRLLNRHMASPFVSLRARGASGSMHYVNSGNLTGYSLTGSTVVVYFGMNRAVHLDCGLSVADVEATLEAAGHETVTLDVERPVSTPPVTAQASDIPAYDVDRYSLPGRV